MFMMQAPCSVTHHRFGIISSTGGIDSNDVLMYPMNEPSNNFVDKVNGMMKSITKELQHILWDSLSNMPQKQKWLAWKLLRCILTNCNLDTSSRNLTSLAFYLWEVNLGGAYEKEINVFLTTIRVENQSGNLSKLLRKINHR